MHLADGSSLSRWRHCYGVSLSDQLVQICILEISSTASASTNLLEANTRTAHGVYAQLKPAAVAKAAMFCNAVAHDTGIKAVAECTVHSQCRLVLGTSRSLVYK